MNFPLFLHVFGAMLLVGTLFAVALATFSPERPDDAVGLTRFSLKTLLMGVLPAYILMRIGAQWTESKEHFPDNFRSDLARNRLHMADGGAFLILISSILSGSVCGSCGSGSGASPSGARSA